MKETRIDVRKIFRNIPSENCLPHHRSELRRLYKRLVARLGKEFNHVVKEDAKPAKSIPGREEQDERALLEKKCGALIRTLNTCIRLHSPGASSEDK